MSHNPAVFDEQSYTEHLKQLLGTTVVKRPLNSTYIHRLAQYIQYL